MFFNKLLTELCLDPRIPDGIFRIEDLSHILILREYLMNRDIPIDVATDYCNEVLMCELGKHPERQAYNKDGLLVTFPTPKHKENAISRGTHFEKDPSKGESNIFNNDVSKSADQTAQGELPPTDSPQAPQQVAGLQVEPQQDQNNSGEPVTNQDTVHIEPPKEKTPEEKEAEKEVIKQIIQDPLDSSSSIISESVNPISVIIEGKSIFTFEPDGLLITNQKGNVKLVLSPDQIEKTKNDITRLV